MANVTRRAARNNKPVQRETGEYRRLALTHATETLLGVKVCGVEYPGGKSRESLLMLLEDDKTVIATRRSKISRARVEAGTLTALNKHQVPVPTLIANNHSHILIQEEIKGTRLSLALKDANEETYASLISAALDSLVSIHSAATAEKLESLVSTLGEKQDWIRGLINRPQIMGKYLGIEAPDLDKTALINFLKVREPRFIKWDSRPGNAMLDNNGNVIWFDWEHAGKRNRLDDAAWVLGDEFVPEYPKAELALIEKYVPRFADGMSAQEAHDYLMVYGVFHITIRLGLILRLMDGKWWDLDYCIAGDKVGVTLMCARRLCARGSRWSSRCTLTQPLSQWFDDICCHLESL